MPVLFGNYCKKGILQVCTVFCCIMKVAIMCILYTLALHGYAKGNEDLEGTLLPANEKILL